MPGLAGGLSADLFSGTPRRLGRPFASAHAELRATGYIDIPGSSRSLFYTFETSQRNPDLDPLVLWLNGAPLLCSPRVLSLCVLTPRPGGPGCSSLGGGWMSELGANFPDSTGTLHPNPYAWSRLANILYLESPAGVGFSSFADPADATVGDARTAADARLFLLGFQQKFPQFASSPLYVAGESYGGHYVPTLAKAILDGNVGLAQGAPGYINLEGIMVGNAWTNAAMDNQGAADHWHGHYHISTATHQAMLDNCDFAVIGPLLLAEAGRVHARREGMTAPLRTKSNDACDDAVNEAQRQIGSLNIYQMFSDIKTDDYTCESGQGKPTGQAERLLQLLGQLSVNSSGLNGARNPIIPRTAALTPLLPNIAGRRSLRAAQPHQDGDDGSGFPFEDACIDDHVERYLNTPSVRAALNVRPDAPYWTDCTNRINYSYQDLLSSIIPVHQALIATGLIRTLIFSGDVDGIVPTAGSRAWVESMGLKETASWHPWYSTGGDHFGTQLGGYAVEYEGGFSFATVRGAGHMVPYTQGSRALDLFTAFLNKTPL